MGTGNIGSFVYKELKSHPELYPEGIDVYDISNGFDLSDPQVIEQCLIGKNAVIATTPYFLNYEIAKKAAELNVVYFDVTEDVKTTEEISKFDLTVPFFPQCGLAPGMVSIIANELAKEFETVEEIKIRVGALPQTPNNVMKYNFTWSTIGLINEYCNPCMELVDGEVVWRSPLSNHETLRVCGMDLEAATTSGGVGSLIKSWEGKAKTINYKTLRYPGHYDYMRFLLHDLKMSENKDLFEKLFDKAIPKIENDMIVIFIAASGYKSGRFGQKTYEKIIHPIEGNELAQFGIDMNKASAIQVATVHGLLAVFDSWLNGNVKKVGIVRQEDLNFEDISLSVFSEVYFK